MTVRIYTSQDTSAPTLSGSNGDLVNLLDKVLVAGYGSQTAAGWTKPYTAANRASFKQGAGCGFYIDVLDDGSLTGGAREAQFSGFEVMTAAATGTGEFPTAAQQATRLKFRKSETADAVTRQWICFADNKTFYLFASTGNATVYYTGMGFGDFYTFKSADAYNCIAIGRVVTAAADTLTNENLDTVSATLATTTGHYIARGYAQTGTSVQVGKTGFTLASNAAAQIANPSGGGVVFPNPTDGAMYMSRLYLADTTTAPTVGYRGFLRGLWNPQHTGSSIPFEYVFSGIGSLSGRTFKTLGLRTGNSGAARYCLETSDTWD